MSKRTIEEELRVALELTEEALRNQSTEVARLRAKIARALGEIEPAKGYAKEYRRPSDSDALPSAVEIKLDMIKAALS